MRRKMDRDGVGMEKLLELGIFRRCVYVDTAELQIYIDSLLSRTRCAQVVVLEMSLNLSDR